MTIHCRLAVLMAKKHPPLTQRGLAKETGLSPTTVNRLCRNLIRRADVSTVDRLCNDFKCQVGDLFVVSKKEK
jgi:putative transcriptional regulator